MERRQGRQTVVRQPKNSKDALEFIHTLDSIAIKKQKEEIDRLKAENKRLRTAGDAIIQNLDPEEGDWSFEDAQSTWQQAKEGRD